MKNKMSISLRQYYYQIFPDIQFLEEMKKLKILTLETVNICNANCIFCGYQYMEREKRIISDSTFKKAINDFVLMGGGNLSLTTVVGDPLLDPKFVERVLYARSFSCIRRITTITNCLNLDKIGVEGLLRSGLNEICISMTSFNQEMFQRVFRSNRYERMKENVLSLLRTNNEFGRPVKIKIAMRVDKPLEEVLTYPGFEEVITLVDSIDSNHYYDNWSGRIKSKDLTGNMKIRPALFHFMKKKSPCSMMYSGIGILVDGTVTVCPCRDLNGKSDLVIGNVINSSLRDIYYSENIEKLRDSWLKGKYMPDICCDCSHYNPYTYLMLSEIRKNIM